MTSLALANFGPCTCGMEKPTPGMNRPCQCLVAKGLTPETEGVPCEGQLMQCPCLVSPLQALKQVPQDKASNNSACQPIMKQPRTAHADNKLNKLRNSGSRFKIIKEHCIGFETKPGAYNTKTQGLQATCRGACEVLHFAYAAAWCRQHAAWWRLERCRLDVPRWFSFSQ